MSKPKRDKLGSDLEKLAEQIAKDLLKEAVPTSARLDGMKVLTTYWASTRKIQIKQPNDEDGVVDFTTIRDSIKAVS